MELDVLDKDIIRELQNDFPLQPRPYLEIAGRLNITEDEVIERLDSMVKEGFIRKVGAIIAPKKIGFRSLLGAIDAPEDKIDRIVNIINEFPGVTHNYLRDTRPNIWFTITARDEIILERNLSAIEEQAGTKVIRMPVTKMFRIGVQLDI
jgi:DNA-binding Lrp family transcriptional regulator